MSIRCMSLSSHLPARLLRRQWIKRGERTAGTCPEVVHASLGKYLLGKNAGALEPAPGGSDRRLVQPRAVVGPERDEQRRFISRHVPKSKAQEVTVGLPRLASAADVSRIVVSAGQYPGR